jgi:DUF4097 and DUF4098 domain-containing protein YvlB
MALSLYFPLQALRQQGVQFQVGIADATSAKTSEEQRYGVDGPATLVVVNAAGNVSVTGGEGNEVVVGIHKTAWAGSQAQAEADLAGMEVQVTQEGNTVTVRFEQPAAITLMGATRPDTVDFTIQVPLETSLDVSTGAGEISVQGTTGSAALNTSYGDVAVSQLQGELVVSTSSGVVQASSVQAGQEKIDLHSDYGDVTLEQTSAGDVALSSSSGSLTMEDVQATGEVTLNSGYGNLAFSAGSAASLELETSSGSATLSDLEVAGEAKVHSDYGSLELEQVMAETYLLSSNSGNISVLGAQGTLSARSDYGNLEVTADELAALGWNQQRLGDVQRRWAQGPHAAL